MYSIFVETKETISLKKKQIEENQAQVNQLALDMAGKVHKTNQLKAQVEQLENDLYKLEKHLRNSENDSTRERSDNGCCVSAGPKSVNEAEGCNNFSLM